MAVFPGLGGYPVLIKAGSKKNRIYIFFKEQNENMGFMGHHQHNMGGICVLWVLWVRWGPGHPFLDLYTFISGSKWRVKVHYLH